LNRKIPSPGSEIQALDTFDPNRPISGVDSSCIRRLWGRYGAAAPLVADSSPDHLKTVPGTSYLWSELIWSVKNEAVQHLDDLLLRRFRLGIVLPDGGQSLLNQLKALLQEQFGWNDERWEDETKRYCNILKVSHGLPQDWKREK